MGNKREGPQRRKREEGILEMENCRRSTVGIHAAVGVIVVLYESGNVVVGVGMGAGAAQPLKEDGKQKRLHRHFRHLPRPSVLQSKRGRDRCQLWGPNPHETLSDEQNERSKA